MPLPTLQLDLDLSGAKPENFIIDEPHAVSPGARAVFLNYGPFYAEGLTVKNADTGDTLTLGDDYVPAVTYVRASMQSARDVYCFVVMNNLDISNILVSAHMVGGEFSRATDLIAELLLDISLDDRPVEFGSLLGLPSGFNPAPHLHPLSQIYGFEYLVNAIDDLAQAVRVGDQASHAQIIDYIDTRFTNEVPVLANIGDYNSAGRANAYINGPLLKTIIDTYASGGGGGGGSLTITTTNTDVTPGALLKVGDYGNGVEAVLTETNADNYTVAGKFTTPGSGLVGFPSEVISQVDGTARALVEVIGGTTAGIYQRVRVRNRNRTWGRSASNSAGLSAAKWQIESPQTPISMVSSSVVLTASAVSIAYVVTVAGVTVTLPAANSVNSGDIVDVVFNVGVTGPANPSTMTLATNGGDTLRVYRTGSPTTMTMYSGERVRMVSDGNATWTAVNHDMFANIAFGGINTALTGTKGDFSTQIATQAFVKNRGLGYESIVGIAANTTLSTSQFGRAYAVNNTGLTLTLPTPVGNTGETITVFGNFLNTTNTSTIATTAGNFTGAVYNSSGSASTVPLKAGDKFTFVSDGANWYCVAATRMYDREFYNSLKLYGTAPGFVIQDTDSASSSMYAAVILRDNANNDRGFIGYSSSDVLQLTNTAGRIQLNANSTYLASKTAGWDITSNAATSRLDFYSAGSSYRGGIYTDSASGIIGMVGSLGTTALYIDSANNTQLGTSGSGFIYIETTSGRLGFKTSSPGAQYDFNGVTNSWVQMRMADLVGAGAGSIGQANGAEFISSRGDANGTFASRLALAFRRTDGTAITAGTALGAVQFGSQYGADTTFQSAKIRYPASIVAFAEGSHTASTAMATGMGFYVGTTGYDVRTPNNPWGTKLAMYITSGGNIGIGKSAGIIGALDVVGGIRSDSSVSVVSTNPSFTLQNTSATASTMVNYIGFADNTGNVKGYVGYTSGNGELLITNTAGAIKLDSVTTARLRVTFNAGYTHDSGFNIMNSFIVGGTVRGYNGADSTGMYIKDAAGVSRIVVSTTGAVSVSGNQTNSGYVTFESANNGSTTLGNQLTLVNTNTSSNWTSVGFGKKVSGNTTTYGSIAYNVSTGTFELIDGVDNQTHADLKLSVLNAVNVVASSSVSGNSGAFNAISSQNSSGLLLLNATNISSGTLNAARLPYAMVHQGGGISQSNNTVYIGWSSDASGLRATVDSTDLGKFAFQDWVTTSIAANFQSRSGGSGGSIDLVYPTQAFTDRGNVSGTLTANSSFQRVTAIGNITWSFPVPLGLNGAYTGGITTGAVSYFVELQNGGNFTMSFPSGTRIAGGMASSATFTTSGIDQFIYTITSSGLRTLMFVGRDIKV